MVLVQVHECLTTREKRVKSVSQAKSNGRSYRDTLLNVRKMRLLNVRKILLLNVRKMQLLNVRKVRPVNVPKMRLLNVRKMRRHYNEIYS